MEINSNRETNVFNAAAAGLASLPASILQVIFAHAYPDICDAFFVSRLQTICRNFRQALPDVHWERLDFARALGPLDGNAFEARAAALLFWIKNGLISRVFHFDVELDFAPISTYSSFSSVERNSAYFLEDFMETFYVACQSFAQHAVNTLIALASSNSRAGAAPTVVSIGLEENPELATHVSSMGLESLAAPFFSSILQALAPAGSEIERILVQGEISARSYEFNSPEGRLTDANFWATRLSPFSALKWLGIAFSTFSAFDSMVAEYADYSGHGGFAAGLKQLCVGAMSKDDDPHLLLQPFRSVEIFSTTPQFLMEPALNGALRELPSLLRLDISELPEQAGALDIFPSELFASLGALGLVALSVPMAVGVFDGMLDFAEACRLPARGTRDQKPSTSQALKILKISGQSLSPRFIGGCFEKPEAEFLLPPASAYCLGADQLSAIFLSCGLLEELEIPVALHAWPALDSLANLPRLHTLRLAVFNTKEDATGGAEFFGAAADAVQRAPALRELRVRLFPGCGAPLGGPAKASFVRAAGRALAAWEYGEDGGPLCREEAGALAEAAAAHGRLGRVALRCAVEGEDGLRDFAALDALAACPSFKAPARAARAAQFPISRR
eukprot:tig00000113_g5697.t1